MTAVKRLITDNSGSTAVEFAFVFPIFITMVLGILEFGIMSYMRGTIEEVTRNTARLAVTGSVIDGEYVTRTDGFVAHLRNRVKSVSVGEGDITVSSTSYPNLSSYGSSSGGSAGVGSGYSITEYEVRYNYQFLTPLAAIIQSLRGDVLIISTAVVQNENF